MRMWVEKFGSKVTVVSVYVILLVRMWVEKKYFLSIFPSPYSHPPCEDVSWKIELSPMQEVGYCHPPCEDVSWKTQAEVDSIVEGRSSSLWGCELKSRRVGDNMATLSHPPCEDVSWKDGEWDGCKKAAVVILLVRMWVEKLRMLYQQRLNQCHPPCEDVSWKIFHSGATATRVVILLVRMWVEKFQR